MNELMMRKTYQQNWQMKSQFGRDVYLMGLRFPTESIPGKRNEYRCIQEIE